MKKLLVSLFLVAALSLGRALIRHFSRPSPEVRQAVAKCLQEAKKLRQSWEAQGPLTEWQESFLAKAPALCERAEELRQEHLKVR